MCSVIFQVLLRLSFYVETYNKRSITYKLQMETSFHILAELIIISLKTKHFTYSYLFFHTCYEDIRTNLKHIKQVVIKVETTTQKQESKSHFPEARNKRWKNSYFVIFWQKEAMQIYSNEETISQK